MSPCNEDGQNIALLNRVGSRTNNAKCREFDPHTCMQFFILLHVEFIYILKQSLI